MMNDVEFETLSSAEKAAFTRKNGQFVEAQDFYSFFILVYLVDKDQVKLLYDYSGRLVSVETDEETSSENFVTNQFHSSFDTLD